MNDKYCVVRCSGILNCLNNLWDIVNSSEDKEVCKEFGTLKEAIGELNEEKYNPVIKKSEEGFFVVCYFVASYVYDEGLDKYLIEQEYEINGDFDKIKITKLHATEILEDRTIKEYELLNNVTYDSLEVVYESENYAEAVDEFSELNSDVLNITKLTNNTVSLDIIVYELQLYKDGEVISSEKSDFYYSEYNE